MLWELSVTEQRYRAVLEVRAGVPVTEVADRYGVSRQSVHAWLRRYRDEGPSGLADRSHKVHQHPWQIPAELEAAVCELRRAHPKWGPKRLVFEMDRRGHGTVKRSTVYRVLVRNGLIEPKSRKRRRQDCKRWERPVAMQLWQLDVTASAFLANGREVKIVTGIDDHFRYCVIATAVMRAHRPAGVPGVRRRHEDLRRARRGLCRITGGLRNQNGQYKMTGQCDDQARISAALVIWTGYGQTPGRSAANSASPAR